MHLDIRDARPEDAEGIVDVLNPIIEARTYTALVAPYTADAERDYIQDFPTRGVFLVAVSQTDHVIVGFQSMEPFATYTHAFDHVGVLGAPSTRSADQPRGKSQAYLHQLVRDD
jgi:L-amino acid N-acyltransferase YncA